MYENKEAFVSTLETALIMYSRVGIVSLKYEYITHDKEDYDEIVTISFKGGHKKRINVTGDSCLGLMNDIRRALM